MDTTVVNRFSNILPHDITDLIHRKLIACPRWLVATNRANIDFFQKAESATDSGLILCSYENKDKDYQFSPDDNNDPIFRELNFFADLVLELVLKRCYDDLGFDRLAVFKNVKVIRYFWNYYHNDSKGTPHIDSDENNHWSIVFYINHCPEGGTIIINQNETENIIEHVPGEAVLFPSSFKHYGLSPNENHHRCCLNILFTADRVKNIVNIAKE
jgi:hypothetical protein